MAKLSTTELLDAFKELTLIELSEFIKEFETTFGVTAAAPVAVADALLQRRHLHLAEQCLPVGFVDRHTWLVER